MIPAYLLGLFVLHQEFAMRKSAHWNGLTAIEPAIAFIASNSRDTL
jgi:hypothetical protein